MTKATGRPSHANAGSLRLLACGLHKRETTRETTHATHEKFNLYRTDGKHVVQIASHRGKDLSRFLSAHGIDGTLVQGATCLLDSIEVDTGVDLRKVQGALRHWENVSP